ncbi:MAG TPA: hypothetical protein VMZ53_04020 [Kofleriaceae bacterium]|nr:hypothetical protein [Kofleriaceae bacterium]
MRLSCMLVALVGCGRLAFDPLSTGGDGGDGQSGDAQGACAFGPWSTPIALPINSASDEFGATPSPDGLELTFHSNRIGGNHDLYVATRATHDDDFGNVQPLTVVNSTSVDENATFAPDGLTLFFTSDRAGGSRLYKSTRASVGAAWSAPVMVPELASVALSGPVLSKQGTELYVTIGSSGVFHVERATYDGSTFTQPAIIPELGTTLQRGYPGISPDGLTLAYEGQRTSYEISFVTRPTIDAPWGAESPFVEVNDASANEDVEWSYDGTELFFTSNRMNVAGNLFDLFVVKRSCL